MPDDSGESSTTVQGSLQVRAGLDNNGPPKKTEPCGSVRFVFSVASLFGLVDNSINFVRVNCPWLLHFGGQRGHPCGRLRGLQTN